MQPQQALGLAVQAGMRNNNVPSPVHDQNAWGGHTSTQAQTPGIGSQRGEECCQGPNTPDPQLPFSHNDVMTESASEPSDLGLWSGSTFCGIPRSIWLDGASRAPDQRPINTLISQPPRQASQGHNSGAAVQLNHIQQLQLLAAATASNINLWDGPVRPPLNGLSGPDSGFWLSQQDLLQNGCGGNLGGFGGGLTYGQDWGGLLNGLKPDLLQNDMHNVPLQQPPLNGLSGPDSGFWLSQQDMQQNGYGANLGGFGGGLASGQALGALLNGLNPDLLQNNMHNMLLQQQFQLQGLLNLSQFDQTLQLQRNPWTLLLEQEQQRLQHIQRALLVLQELVTPRNLGASGICHHQGDSRAGRQGLCGESDNANSQDGSLLPGRYTEGTINDVCKQPPPPPSGPSSSRAHKSPIFQAMATVQTRQQPFKKVEPSARQGSPSQDTTYVPGAKPRAELSLLSRELLGLVAKLQPTPEERQHQQDALETVRSVLVKHWPKCKVHQIGSTANQLSICNTGIDVCLELPDLLTDTLTKGRIVDELGVLLVEAGLQNVQPLPKARVPVVKVVVGENGVKVDITVNNILAIVNTKLLGDYVKIDERLLQLCCIVKHWAERRQVNDSHRGTFSSYCYVLICIHLLQQRQPAILPCLQARKPATFQRTVGQWVCDYFDDLEQLKDFGKANKESLGDLVWAFFEQWAWKHDYKDAVVSVRTGSFLTKSQKEWTRRVGNERHLVCIEDPFELMHDLGRTVDRQTSGILRKEFERAACVLRDLPKPLDKLLEPYHAVKGY